MAAALRGPGAATEARAAPQRPDRAVGTFLRLVTVNDVYVLKNYPKVASAIIACKEAASSLDCVVTSHLNGDFLSPTLASALDSGKAMMEGLNQAKIEFACLGNHEFDLGHDTLKDRASEFKGKLINSNITSECCADMPKYASVKVGDKTVVIAGVCTGSPDIYSKAVMPEFLPLNDALKDTWNQAKKELGAADIFVPMTHQLIPEDEATAKFLSETEDLQGRVPVILGGHEHEIYSPEVCGTKIIKMGADAATIGFVDIWWDKDGKVQSSLHSVPAERFPDEVDCANWVKKQEDLMTSLLSVPIAQLPWPCSTKRTRYEESKMASFLSQLEKRGMQADGVEVVFHQGGSIRGKQDYEAGDFTLAMLFKEMPFDNVQAIFKLPGKVLVDTVRTARDKPEEEENSSFIHLDLDCEVGEGHELFKIDGKPVDPEKEYICACSHANLLGMNRLEPMLSYAKSGKMRIPEEEECLPVKQWVLAACMKDAWRELLGLGQWKPGAAGDVRASDLKTKVAEEFKQLDKDGSGLLSKEEVVHALREKKLSCGLLERMIAAIDTNGDGQISMVELVSVVQ